MCREEDLMEEERCEDEKAGDYRGPSKWPHLAELRVCDGEEWLNSKEILLLSLTLNHLTCASQRLSLPWSLSTTQNLILGCLGSWFS